MFESPDDAEALATHALATLADRGFNGNRASFTEHMHNRISLCQRVRYSGGGATVIVSADDAGTVAAFGHWLIHGVLATPEAPAVEWALVDAHCYESAEGGPDANRHWTLIFSHLPTGVGVARMAMTAVPVTWFDTLPASTRLGAVADAAEVALDVSGGMAVDVETYTSPLADEQGLWAVASSVEGLCEFRYAVPPTLWMASRGWTMQGLNLVGLAASPLVATPRVLGLSRLRATPQRPLDERGEWSVLEVIGAVPVRDEPWAPTPAWSSGALTGDDSVQTPG